MHELRFQPNTSACTFVRAQALVRLVNHKLKNGDKANDRNPFEIKKGLEVPLIRLHACCTLHAARCMLHVACCTLHAARCMLHVQEGARKA